MQLHVCCYSVARVLWIVARVLLCSCMCVAIQLLGCCGLLPGHCYAAACVFCRFSVLPFSC